MNKMQSGFQYLREKLTESASDEIEIFRLGESIGKYTAVFARTRIEDIDGTQKRIFLFVFDFIIRGDEGYEPQRGDRILLNDKWYVVRAINKEMWRWDDPYHTMIRVHTQEEIAKS